MRSTDPSRFLFLLLWADAASAAASGALQVVAAPSLARWFGLPPALVLASGGVLLAVAAFAAWLARSPRRGGVLTLVGLNAAWVLGCLELLLSGGALTALGTGWLVLQAVAVGVLAELEWLALRRVGRTAFA
ncbi:hypothetical protein [Ramlibacter sp. AN1133]|uniref:hypothetical protein n=1 Tax=Ramlibacter sp. AN1133 TaxID=3133429 RepID=UPI0030BA4AAE